MFFRPLDHRKVLEPPAAVAFDPKALFIIGDATQRAGYSTMCGHATIALGRWAVDTGRVALS